MGRKSGIGKLDVLEALKDILLIITITCFAIAAIAAIKAGVDPGEAYQKNLGTYGRFKAEDGAVQWIDPRKE